MAKQVQTQLFQTVSEKAEQAKEMALDQIKALKSDLTDLEKFLTGKKMNTEPALIDITYGAFEIFRNASLVMESQNLLNILEGEKEVCLAKEYLESKGAMLLSKPEGWYWVSQKGEMILLEESKDALKAAAKLKKRLSRKTAKKNVSTVKPEPSSQQGPNDLKKEFAEQPQEKEGSS